MGKSRLDLSALDLKLLAMAAMLVSISIPVFQLLLFFRSQLNSSALPFASWSIPVSVTFSCSTETVHSS